jgi:uncharacterized protein (DUF58 family)
MQWKKITLEDRFLSILAFLGSLMLIASFYLDSMLIFASGLLILFISAGTSYYFKHIGEGLIFENTRQRNRFFIGDQGEWSLQFVNYGLPILNAKITVFFENAVVPVSGEFHSHQSKIEVTLPVSMNRREQINIRIPFLADRRGMSKIRNMELHIPNFGGFGETILEFKDVITMEALVYPKTIPVRNINQHKSQRPGISPSVLSVFENNMGPVGTRDYLPTDSFNRINWKASARRMTLQTKEFERINESGAVMYVNMVDGFSVTSNLEFLMSSIAEMAYFLHKKSIPFSLCMNIRSAGVTPFTYLPMGSGEKHLQKLLDVLAITDFHSPTIPYEKMLFYCKRHLPAAPTMIHAGIRTSGTDQYFNDLWRDGIHLLELQKHEENAFLEPLKLLKKEVAVNE